MLEQESDDPVDGFGVDRMVVVENEGKLSGQGSELVDKGGRYSLDARWLRRTQRGENALANPPLDEPKCGHQIGEEAGGVIVSLVQREPGDGRLAARPLPQPLDEQGSLAEARRGGDQRQLASHLSLEPCGQPRARDQV